MQDLALVLGLVALIVGVALAAVAYEGHLRAERGAIDLVGRVATPDGGGWSRREIRAREGEVVRLRLTSADVTHGFLIPDLGIASEPIRPGEYVEVTFVAERAGEYRYYCNVLCGHRHGAMIGMLVVEPRQDSPRLSEKSNSS